MAEADPMEGRSGHPIPEEYGKTEPYFKMALLAFLPAAVLSSLAAALLPAAPCRALAQLGAACAFGSNIWLFCYGKKMFKVCTANESGSGKEAFSTIQAACFPAFFGLQTSATAFALGGHVGASGFDVAAMAAATALFFGLLNLLVLGPKSMPLMMDLYNAAPAKSGSNGDALLPLRQAKKRFGMVHGISMLVDLLALAAMGAFIVAAAVRDQ
eukprot:CAMPEP_0117475704 /NCGR_PEP_ID=MMETSP0784-20121206/9932_1 /TAXON_ID=39447 /ORGANISM="" /LENGTH=212 /DNA_ID=CAMNT_0005269959 /DNA_START=21 /DNA_END=660 /DNA_ORIENTATION=-